MNPPAPTGRVRRVWQVTRVLETGSTNTDLVAAARVGAPDGAVLVAGRQTAGRGRLDRVWEAPPDASLLASVLIRPVLDLSRVHLATQWMALAAADACREVAGVALDLKWPNDLLVGERKVCGILAEAVVSDGQLKAVVVGIGINVNWPHFPAALSGTATALNHHHDGDVDLDRLLESLLAALGDGPDPEQIPPAYRARLTTIGQPVQVTMANETFNGLAADVLEDGRLVVVDEAGRRRTVSAGDVVHLRTHH